MEADLRQIQCIADYQFGAGVGAQIFPETVQIAYSKATGKIRYISLNGNRLATLRPTDGMLSLSLVAARSLRENAPCAHCFVNVKQDVAEFIAKGGDVFAAHVIRADEDIHAKDEVIVLDESGSVLAVGRATLSAGEMTAFKTGVAVKVRHGSSKES